MTDAIHGYVSNIKALPAKQVTRVEIEVPLEFHALATNILFNTGAVVMPAATGANVPHGVTKLDNEADNPAPVATATEAATEEGSTAEDPPIEDAGIQCAYGFVTNIKALPSRQPPISRIEIELPIECHADVTRMLFGRNAFLLKAEAGAGLNGGYGLVKLNSTQATPSQASVKQSRPQQQSQPQKPKSSLSFDVKVWLGIHCSKENFQTFLGVVGSEAARDRVCTICGVNSRREIQGDPQAEELFVKEILRPFNLYKSSETV